MLRQAKQCNVRPLPAPNAALCSRRVLQVPVPRRSVVKAATNDKQPASEAYVIAAMRLQQLLKEANWDMGEAIRHELSTFSVGERLTFITNCGSLVTLIAFVLSWASGEDPMGGIGLTSASLEAAKAGLWYSLPLVACSLAARAPACRALFPLLEDLHTAQADLLAPLLKGMNLSQLLIVASTLSIPSLMLLLPAMRGTTHALGHYVRTEAVEPLLLSGGGMAAPLHATTRVESAAQAAAAAAASGAPDIFTLPTAAEVAAADLLATPLPLAPGALMVTDVGALFGSKLMPAGSAGAGVAAGISHAAAEAGAAWDRVLPLHVLSHEAGVLAPAVLGGFLAAYLVMKQLMPKGSHVAAIRDAITHADRWFRLTMSMDTNVRKRAPTNAANRPPATASGAGPVMMMAASVGPTNNPRDEDEEGGSSDTTATSQAVSEAFKRVSLLWLITRRRVCQLAYMLTALNVVYYYLIWHETQDLATPAVAALVAIMAELVLTQGAGPDQQAAATTSK